PAWWSVRPGDAPAFARVTRARSTPSAPLSPQTPFKFDRGQPPVCRRAEACTVPVPAPRPTDAGFVGAMAAPRLVILAANCLYREGLAALLGAEADVCVAATAGDWPHALAVVGKQRPAVLLVDLDTPGVEAGIRALRRAAHPPAVVALGADGGDDAAVAWAEMGLAGWISRAATAADVLRVVRDAGRGELRCTARTTAALARRLAEVSATNARDLP